MTEIGFGIFCTNAERTLSTNHTFRLKSLSFDRVFESLSANLRDLFELLELCRREKIEVFRLGSNFIPYASHKDFKEEWFLKIEPFLIETGKTIRENFNIRITMHPGQFVILNSPKLEVIDNSLRELRYHFWVLDKLGIGDDGIVIIHIGGIYSEKERAIERFINTVEKNSWLKKRLAVENDERLFTAKDTLYVAKNLKIPFVFDYFHHVLNPSIFDFNDIYETWRGKGTPKFHLSSQGDGKYGLHGDYVKLDDFYALMELIEVAGLKKVHIMLEAKQKEKAINRLRSMIWRHNQINL